MSPDRGRLCRGILLCKGIEAGLSAIDSSVIVQFHTIVAKLAPIH